MAIATRVLEFVACGSIADRIADVFTVSMRETIGDVHERQLGLFPSAIGAMLVTRTTVSA